MNITNIKNEITNFLGSMNIDVVNISYVPGVVRNSINEYTGEQFEERTDDIINVTLKNDPELTEQQNHDLSDFEQYVYSCYHGLVINYELTTNVPK